MRILLLIFSLCFSLISIAQETVKQGDFLGTKIVESLPDWFKTSFMDFSEDLEEASNKNRHMMIYFHQNGCPYCAKLVEYNFHDKGLVAKLKKNFDVVETNIWGDKVVTDWTGKTFTEKEFATHIKIQFTPTLVFLSPQGEVLLRLNGYQSIEKMHAALDYIANKTYLESSYANYLNKLKQNKEGKLNSHPIFASAPHLLTRGLKLSAEKVLAVFFEEPNCKSCDYFHTEIMPLKQTQNHLKQMQVVRFNALSDEKLITPSGKRTTAKDWYESLKLTYKPAIVFFDRVGNEVIRKDAYFKSYHLHSIMDYVLTGAYKTQPNFQRYIEYKSDELREQGAMVNIWE